MIINKRKFLALIVVLVLIFITACTNDKNNNNAFAERQGNQENQESVSVEENQDEKEIINENEAEEEASIEEQQDHPPVDLKALKVNELGKIMILMYHDIGEPEDIWVRTPENFRKDLQTLYDKGYRAISMKDYIEGNIDTPPGTTPVVITFDDGTKGQFNILDEDGEFVINPDSAVGILEEFNKEHPDFGLKATFMYFILHLLGKSNG